MHGTVSFLTNRFLPVIGSQTLGFGRRRYGRLFLATARLLVLVHYELTDSSDVSKYEISATFHH